MFAFKKTKKKLKKINKEREIEFLDYQKPTNFISHQRRYPVNTLFSHDE